MSKDIKRNYNNNDDFVELFEQRLCEYTGAPYAVAVDRCTNAILLSLAYNNTKRYKISIPKRTYLSVPMTLINYGYNVWLEDIDWQGHYQIGRTNVYDYAVGFEKNMYVAGQVQCVSFQQKKRLAIGKGGAILLDNKEMYLKLKRMRHDGRTSSMSTMKEMETAPDDIILGYHMYMSPDEAARGILLINQLSEHYSNGSSLDYPDISVLKCLRDYK
jgi:dTDP-4-amino-4,6-dideoxygalactose transaminase